MEELNLPKAELKTKAKDGKTLVFDPLRRRYVTLTPEEWVRQHFVRFLIDHKGYPSACIGNEVSLTLNGTHKRCDTVVYGRHALPAMIIEYKAPSVSITQRVFQQICRYNMALKVSWLVVSNGVQHYCCHIDYERGTYSFTPDIPTFSDVTGITLERTSPDY